jgi:dethiobiotin synthetase
MITIDRQTFTFFADQLKAAALAANLKADDPETDYRVVEGARGFFVAIFEDGTQVFTL